MENTTNALMMAAGILIGIIILSLTVYLVNSIRGFSRNYNESLELQKLEQFNTKFTVFQGRNNISMHEIVTLVNLAKEFNKTNNLKNTDSQYIHIYAKINTKTFDLTTIDVTRNSINLNNPSIDSLIDGSYIKLAYSNQASYPEVHNYDGKYVYENKYNSDKSKKEKIIYYNCYKCDNYVINKNTGRIEQINFIFQIEYTQNL